jgi:hypothetical protein
MAQWGNTDDAANSVSWAASSLNLGSGNANQAANNESLFANTTAEAFVANVAIGQFGVSTAEMGEQGESGSEAGAVPHAGWVLRTEGTGGRAGRVHYEVLVAGSSITGDADDDDILPDS